MEENLITLDNAKKLLSDNGFFGFTAKREKNNRLEYTYRSIKWYSIVYTIKVLKLGKVGNSKKIVIGAFLNGKELDGWKGFEESFGSLRKIHKK